MYGWIVDRQNNQIVQAPRPGKYTCDWSWILPNAYDIKAFQLKTIKDISQNDSTDEDAEPKISEDDSSEHKVILRIPKYKVNDNSRVDVTISNHEFETSMAKNDFSSQSTEASLYVSRSS